MKRRFESSLDQSLSKPFHGSRAAGVGVGDLRIGPVRTVRVGLQENLRTPNFLTCTFQLLDDLLKLLALLPGQANDV
jgi:hypothetical protein